MLDIIEGRYISQIWFLSGEGTDWLGFLWQDPDQPWKCSYRFRYYSSESQSPHDGKDKKSSFVVTFKQGLQESEALQAVASLVAVIFMRYHKHPAEIVPVRSSHVEQILKVLEAQPWAHLISKAAPV